MPADGENVSAEDPGTGSQRRGAPQHRWWPWVAALVVVAGGAALAARRYARVRSQVEAPRAPPAIAVTTATASRGDIAVHLDALGTVTPIATVTVKTRVDGQL